jgi:hypothetical protein
MSKRNLVVTIILSLIGLVIVAGFFISQAQTAAHQADQQSAVDNEQRAYENVIKDSLNVYHSRYSQYPKDYQALIDDIAKSHSIYGVNDEGEAELKDIGGRLSGFSYTKVGDDAYRVTYQDAASGKSVTVTNN